MSRSNAAYFGVGAVAGSAVTALFFLFKEGIIWAGEGAPPAKTDDGKSTDVIDDSEKPTVYTDAPTVDDSTRVAYNEIISKQAYSETDENAAPDGIHEVSEEDYYHAGREGEYDLKALTLYSNKVLADSVSDEWLGPEDIITNIGEKYTIEFLAEFFARGGEVFYICNERLLTQYEITSDDRTYEEVTGQVIHGN